MGRTRFGGILALVTIGVWGMVGVTVAAATPPTMWVEVPTPNVAGSQGESELHAVSCASATSCVAVGRSMNQAAGTKTLAERFDGTAWTVELPPSPAITGNDLLGVSCVGTRCMAVGGVGAGFDRHATALRSDVSGWSADPVAGLDPAGSFLRGVDCVAVDDCMAVGYTGSSTTARETLVAHWDGTTWSVIPSVDQPSANNYLYGVDCRASNDCTAVGHSFSTPENQTLVEHWNGSVWSIVSSPNPGTNPNDLEAVSCTSAMNCVAVGHQDGDHHLLVERWDGTAWTVDSPAEPPDLPGAVRPRSAFLGVDCATANDCTAVGWTELLATSGRSPWRSTFVEHWDGATWTIERSVLQPSAGNRKLATFWGVDCPPSGCLAVGKGFDPYGKAVIDTRGAMPRPVITELPVRAGATTGPPAEMFIYGSGFTGATRVDFGSVAAPSFEVEADTLISAVRPPHAAGWVNVKVVSPGGTSAITLADRYRFVAAPTITSITPSSGPGGKVRTPVTIRGSGFWDIRFVHFGWYPEFKVIDATTLTLTPSPHAPGTVDVTVGGGPGGSSSVTAASRYRYEPVATP